MAYQPRGGNRFTVYDVMDAQGVFASNPANVDARTKQGQSLYKGPVQYPRMLYHPKGEEKIVRQAEAVATPFGPKYVGELRELVSRTAEDEEQEMALRAEGWHDHPAKAIAALNERLAAEGKPLREVPPMSSEQHIRDLEGEVKRLELELAAAKAAGIMPALSDEEVAEAASQKPTRARHQGAGA